jgi:tRNA threonylcarbamoyladenosine biosynthesis protein TsaE
MTRRLESRSAEETIAIGRTLAASLKPGDVVALSGALGAGKTTLVKGVAEGLGVGEPVTSPTFTLIQEYDGRLPLCHVDLYRIKGSEEIEDLGLEEYFYGAGVTLIEWPEKAAASLPRRAYAVGITVRDRALREIVIEGGDR